MSNQLPCGSWGFYQVLFARVVDLNVVRKYVVLHRSFETFFEDELS